MIALPKDFQSGADISWVPAMEASGFIFRNAAGRPRDIFELLAQDYHINAIRLRTWVHPSEGAFCFSHYALSAWNDDGTPGIGMQAYQEICLEGEPK